MSSFVSGCLKGVISGCLFVVVLVIGLFVLFISVARNQTQGTDAEKNVEVDSRRTGETRYIEASYRWKYVDNNVNRISASIKFEIPEADIEDAMNHLHKLEHLTLAEIGVSSQGSDMDETEMRKMWHAVYQQMYRKGSPQIAKISAKLDSYFEREKMNARDKLLFLSSFVQNIKYKIPKNPLGIYPPVVTLAERNGDCDTKALLLYILLERSGFDCVIMWSGHYAHAMLGVSAGTSGEYKVYKGKRFYFLETTYPDWEVGQLPPEVNNTDYWFTDDLKASARSL